MIHKVLDPLSKAGWNQRVFNSEDFDYYCSREGIEVIELWTGYLGRYLGLVDGVPVILISPSLTGKMREWVLWHELAHHWLHLPGAGFMYYGTNKIEQQADIISTCALLPYQLLGDFNFLSEENYPSLLIQTRIEIFDKYNI